jgi:quinol monooxygenase YgiN
MKHITLGIHYPKKEHQESILDVARKVHDIAQTCEGHIDSGALLDEENDRIIMFSLWQNKESAFEASKILRPIIAEANFQDWERKPSDNIINMKRLV